MIGWLVVIIVGWFYYACVYQTQRCYVEYEDKINSCTMTRAAANSYARIFGGTVRRENRY